MKKLYRDRNWLWRHYIVQKESTHAVAKEAECDPETIRNWLHRLKIPVRSSGEGTFLANRNFVAIAPELLEFMKGEILGDGCVPMHGNRSALYAHSSKYEEYLIWLSGCLDKWGIEQAGRITRQKNKQNGGITYHYASRSYPELIPIRQCWYPNGKKTVSKDLKLTPIMVRQWYLGDSWLAHPKRRHPYIKLFPLAFSKEEVEYLVRELNRLGFKATRHADNSIYISTHSVQDFLEWIGPWPISCYDYKWDYKGENRT